MSTTKCKIVFHKIYKIFKIYCSKSSLHGLRFIGDPYRTYIGRFFWILAIILQFVGCYQFITVMLENWYKDPIILTFNSNLTPVSHFPFPSITICLNPKFEVNQINLNEIIEELQGKRPPNVTALPEWKSIENGLAFLCPSNKLFTQNANQNESHKDMYLMMDKWLPEELLENYYKTFTEFGLCFSENRLAPSDLYRDDVLYSYMDMTNYHGRSPNLISNWSVDEGYTDSNINAYPKRFVKRLFAKDDYVRILRTFPRNLHDKCFLSNNHRLFLSPPYDALPSDEYFLVPADQSALITVKPKVTFSTPKLASYSPKLRGCFFNSERYLRFFKVYSEVNCLIECQANATTKSCGCIQFHMPRLAGIPICGYGKSACTNQVSQLLNQQRIASENTCNCLPLCNEIKYETEFYSNEEKFSRRNDGLDTRLEIKIKELSIIMLKRDELYSFTDLVSKIGGILGVFSGFSTLCMIEIIYFCLIYPCVRRNTYKKSKVIPALTDRKAVVKVPSLWKKKQANVKTKVSIKSVLTKNVNFIKNCFKEYMTNSSISICGFLCDCQFKRFEKIIWFIVLIFSVLFCGIFINDIYGNWYANPLVVSTSSKSKPTGDLPLPTLVFCTSIKFATNLVNVTNLDQHLREFNKTKINFDKIGYSWDAIMTMLRSICIKWTSFRDNTEITYVDMFDIETMFDKFSPSDFIGSCKIGPKYYADCSPFFQKIIVENGLCYAFNLLAPDDLYAENITYTYQNVKQRWINHSTDWNLENGYNLSNGSYQYPLQHAGGDSNEALQFTFNTFEKNMEHVCAFKPKLKLFYGLASDFNVFDSANFIPIPIGEAVKIGINYRFATTKESVRSYLPELRSCYFLYERNLTLFKYYSKINCFVECASIKLINTCGCINFYIPRLPHNRVCQQTDEECYNNVLMNLENDISAGTDNCNCLPLCTTLDYDFDTNYLGPFEMESVQNETSDKKMINKVSFYVKNRRINPIVKNELYTNIQLISSIGGILGLFLGLTLISVFEFLYYCVIHPILVCCQGRAVNNEGAIILDIPEPFYIEKGKQIRI